MARTEIDVAQALVGCTQGEAARAPRRASGEYALVRTNRRAGARLTLNWGQLYSPELPGTSRGTLQHSVNIAAFSQQRGRSLKAAALLPDKRPLARRSGAQRFVSPCSSAECSTSLCASLGRALTV